MNMDSPESLEINLAQLLQKQLATFAVSHEIGRAIVSAVDFPSLVKSLGVGFKELMGFERMALFQIEKKDQVLVPIGEHGFAGELAGVEFKLDFMAGEYSDAVFRNRHIIVEGVPSYDSFSQINSESYIAFPLVGRVVAHCWKERNCNCAYCPCYDSPNPFCWATEGASCFTGASDEDERRVACINCSQFQCLGILWLDLSHRKMVTGEDVSALSTIALQIGMVLENLQMYDALKESNQILSQTNTKLEEAQRIIRRDLDQARKIQERLLPVSFPDDLADVAWHYDSQIEIGGDYFDCFPIDEQNFGIIIADVSGHGVAAALVMSMFKVLLKEMVNSTNSPALTLMAINETFINELKSDQFVTVFYGVWNRHKRTLQWTNAGHPPVFLQNLRSGDLKMLASRGPFVGMLDELSLQDETESLSDQYRLVLYTDGITESENHSGEAFGDDLLHKIVQSTHRKSVDGVKSQVLKALQKHLGSKANNDDITLLVVDI